MRLGKVKVTCRFKGWESSIAFWVLEGTKENNCEYSYRHSNILQFNLLILLSITIHNDFNNAETFKSL